MEYHTLIWRRTLKLSCPHCSFLALLGTWSHAVRAQSCGIDAGFYFGSVMPKRQKPTDWSIIYVLSWQSGKWGTDFSTHGAMVLWGLLTFHSWILDNLPKIVAQYKLKVVCLMNGQWIPMMLVVIAGSCSIRVLLRVHFPHVFTFEWWSQGDSVNFGGRWLRQVVVAFGSLYDLSARDINGQLVPLSFEGVKLKPWTCACSARVKWIVVENMGKCMNMREIILTTGYHTKLLIIPCSILEEQ